MSSLHLPRLGLQLPGLADVPLPRMLPVAQRFDDSRIEDLSGTLSSALQGLSQQTKDSLRGRRICLGVGSRGIPQLPQLVRGLVDFLKQQGAQPFLIPAMGSHGGATAEGQRALLAEFGITPEAMGVPLLSSMEAVEIGRLADGTPVYCDKLALAADGVVVFNKVKPHSDFRHTHESGLAKMCAVGYGKHLGAAALHAQGFQGFGPRVEEAARIFLQRVPVAFGLGVVENALGQLCALEAAEAGDLMACDARLLALARSRMAAIKLNDLDVLIIDEIGKEFSGNGHDPNITGRTPSPGFEDILRCQRMVIRDLSPHGGGNASGLSLADVATRRALETADLRVTWTNLLTAGLPHGCKLPLYAENDWEALRLALYTCPGLTHRPPRVVRIRNTKQLRVIEASEGCLEEIGLRDDLQALGEPRQMAFDAEGNLGDMREA